MSTSCSGNGMAFFPANFMLQQPHHNNDTTHQQQHHPPCSTTTCLSSLLPSCSPVHHEDHFHGAGIGIAPGLGKRSMSFPAAGLEYDQHHEEHHHNLGAGAAGNNNGGVGDEDLSDDGSVQLGGGGGGGGSGEKKRRLNMEQVRTLERNFELGNKLEPERKMQLAKALGLQPRQVAIWFQNRRARWKTKQLEKDYDVLRRQFDALKSDNDALLSQNQKLQAEIMALKNNNSYKEPTESINLNKENTEGSSSNRSENSSREIIKLDMISRTPPPPPPAAAATYFDDHQQHCHSPFSAAAPVPAHHQTPSMPLFPPSSNSSSAAGLSPIINSRHINAGPSHHHFHDHIASVHEELRNHPHDQSAPSLAVLHVKEENNNNSSSSFSNMFVGIDDQPGFWPWLEQHNFN